MDKIDPLTFAHSPTAKQWERIGVKNHHGLVIPLFSLHSEQSCGIGEYLDLLPMIDWCVSIGFDLIQLLPLNDPGWDTSPYSAISAFALNPIHISLASLPYLEESPLLQDNLRMVPKQNYSSRINYTFVREAKTAFLKLYYDTVGQQIISSDGFQDFIDNADWLNEYALFKSIKEAHQFAGWQQWSQELQNPTPDLLNRLYEQYHEEIQWHSFIQYLCHTQLLQVTNHALEKNVYLMGDIPILINYDSADVWLHKELFHLELLAGAPPDIYSIDGQNWGFPIYNWEVIAQQEYIWWKKRLQTASQYYQVYRLDHIIGFFRIWAIPLGLNSKEGHYFPGNQDIWIDHGQRILLNLIESSPMLPIGEDLGIVPDTVRTCLKALGICGTKVLRWEREWETTRKFIPVDNYPLASMTTVSTHDSETLHLWWRDHSNGAVDFAIFKGWGYHEMLSKEHLYEILWDSHHSNSLFHVNLLQEYLALVPGLTWPNPEDERINVPGTVTDSNWSYRFRPSIEEITTNQTLSHLMKEIIQ